MTSEAVGSSATSKRNVGFLLGVGVFLAPYVFAWFTLRRGYSQLARVVSFVWMGLVLLLIVVGPPVPGPSRSASASDDRSAGQVATDALLDPGMKALTDKVARDAVEQYEFAQKSGDKTETCVRAGMVAAAYSQAKDEANYLLWKQRERNDCDRIGIRQP